VSETVEQSKAKWRKAISILRETGMTDEEIAAELGLPDLKVFESQHISTSAERPAKSSEIVVQHDSSCMDEDDSILDVEVVELSHDGAMAGGFGADHLPVPLKTSAPEPNTADSSGYKMHSEEWWQHAKPEVQARRCKAHRKNGDQCKRPALAGTTVCRSHGGASGHVQRAARARLENAADRMAKELLGIATDPNMSAQVKLKAINSALDRAGLRAPNQVVVSAGQTTGFDEVFSDVFTGSRAESRRARGMELGPNDVDALGYSGDTQSEASRATVIDADGYEVSDSNTNIEGIQRFSRDADISGTANRPGGRGYGGVGPSSYGDYDRLRGPQSDRERFRVHHVTGEDAIRVARQQRELTAGD